MNLSALILKLAGWKIEAKAPEFDKCIICVAPHTSNWDFIIGKLAYSALGRKAGFLMKSDWFFFPLGAIFRAIGGIPVVRGKKGGESMVQSIVDKFNSADKLVIAITPEGTRSRTAKWRTGFLYISLQAKVPCVLAAIDYKRKLIVINDVFHPSGDIEADMRAIKDYYKPFEGKNPEKFTTEDE